MGNSSYVSGKKVIPVIVDDIKKLDKAVSREEKVIIVSNKDLFSAIKKNVDKDAKFRKRSGNALKISILAIGGGIGGMFFPPLLVPGIIAATVGVYGTAGSVVIKAISAIKGKLRKYKWVESDDKKLLILLKSVGSNKFDTVNETIDFENARKCEV